MTRTVFYGFGAFVGTISGPTTCGWWPDDPAKLGFAAGALIPIDLGKNPQAVRTNAIKPADIQADDYAGYTFGGLTKIGPMFPGGVMTGACWVESTYWASLAAKGMQPAFGDAQCRPYELTSVLYWQGALAGRRFNGVHAVIHSVQGALANVSIWQPGSSLIPGQPPLSTSWLDLAAVAHPIEKGFTEIGVATGNPTSGALF